MLECEVATILLAEDGADNGTILLAECVSCDVVGDCEEDQWVQLNSERRVGGLARDERVGGGCFARHYGGCVVLRMVEGKRWVLDVGGRL